MVINLKNLPLHLQKYIVQQNYEKYTPLDQAVWRYVLRQLRHFLKSNAHECYLDGLVKTGIDVEEIPRIETISNKLQAFGWCALPVSGFIPPAAFMELQSLGVLPIASDMRSIEHLEYTPAPDIVHEAAGHAPILTQPEYAEYLQQYAQVAKKSILSRHDLDQYEAIRNLSDLKENPNSTATQIKLAEETLTAVTKNISFISEAAELSRMNWWTAEYGLIGDLNNPKLFGAGLLSSIGESKWCLSDKVKKLPLTLDCIKQTYDITEPQPQLYVAKDFKVLTEVLHQMSETMAYKTGGKKGLEKAVKAESVTTVQLDSGLQISGILTKYLVNDSESISYLQFNGPTQISFQDQQLPGHDKTYHAQGYGTPVGELIDKKWSELQQGSTYELKFKTGVVITGTVENLNCVSGIIKIVTFKNATAMLNNEILFKPEWGLYDVAVGSLITSVFGGPADRVAYGETDDFKATTVSAPIYTDKQKTLFSLYQSVRDMRQKPETLSQLSALFIKAKSTASTEWLLFLELLEICKAHTKFFSLENDVKKHLESLQSQSPKSSDVIADGLKLSHEIN